MKKHHQKRSPGNRAAKANGKAVGKSRGLELLPYEIRASLPILGSQQHRGGHAKALAKWLTADGAYAWYITEGSARRDADGQAVDYLLYGLVEGQRRQLDYFWLSDLASFRSPTGALVQRDHHWRPKMLHEIAPELFESQENQPED